MTAAMTKKSTAPLEPPRYDPKATSSTVRPVINPKTLIICIDFISIASRGLPTGGRTHAWIRARTGYTGSRARVAAPAPLRRNARDVPAVMPDPGSSVVVPPHPEQQDAEDLFVTETFARQPTAAAAEEPVLDEGLHVVGLGERPFHAHAPELVDALLGGFPPDDTGPQHEHDEDPVADVAADLDLGAPQLADAPRDHVGRRDREIVQPEVLGHDPAELADEAAGEVGEPSSEGAHRRLLVPPQVGRGAAE